MESATDRDMSPALRELLDEAVQRIVEVAQPQAITLFGSHAEGRAHPQSDLDFLVIAETADRAALTGRLYRVMADLARGRPDEVPEADIIVLTLQAYEQDARLPGLTVWRARRYGVVLYGRAA